MCFLTPDKGHGKSIEDQGKTKNTRYFCRCWWTFHLLCEFYSVNILLLVGGQKNKTQRSSLASSIQCFEHRCNFHVTWTLLLFWNHDMDSSAKVLPWGYTSFVLHEGNQFQVSFNNLLWHLIQLGSWQIQASGPGILFLRVLGENVSHLKNSLQSVQKIHCWKCFTNSAFCFLGMQVSNPGIWSVSYFLQDFSCFHISDCQLSSGPKDKPGVFTPEPLSRPRNTPARNTPYFRDAY